MKTIFLYIVASAIIGFCEPNVNIDPKQKERNKQLLQAAYDGNVDLIIKLISNGADVKCTDGVNTPLLHAANQNQVQAARTLIDYGADKNGADQFGMTPLFRAANMNNVGVVELLIEKKVKLDVKCGRIQKTAREIAEQHEYTHVAEILKKAERERRDLNENKIGNF